MDKPTFIVEVLNALAWPAVTLIIVLLFRDPLARLISTLRRAKYKDFEFEFEEKLKELRSRAEIQAGREIPASAGPGSPPPKIVPDLQERIEPLADISPRAAVTESFRELELSMRDAARKAGKEDPKSTRQLLALLATEGILSQEAASLIEDLRTLRNRAVHAADVDLSPRQAVDYGRLAGQVMSTLKVH